MPTQSRFRGVTFCLVLVLIASFSLATFITPQPTHANNATCGVGPSLQNPYSNDIYAVAEYNGTPYAGGWFHIRHQLNGTWQTVGSGVTGGGGYTLVGNLIEYDGKLIAGGAFFAAGGLSAANIASWDDTSWAPLGAGLNDEVTALTVWNGDLIAGGTFTASGANTMNRIALWDGTGWKALGSGFTGAGGSGFTTEVWDLTVYDGDLIASGRFEFADGKRVDGLARWDGVEWHPMGALAGFSGDLGVGTSVETWNGDLYLSGYFSSVGGTPITFMAKWDGVSWLPAGTAPGWHSLSMEPFNGHLYATGPGSFDIDGTEYDVAYWDGAQWNPVAVVDGGWPNDLYPSADGNTLFIGGYFGAFNGQNIGQIVQWQCTDSQQLRSVDIRLQERPGDRVGGLVQVEDTAGQPLAGATVFAQWSLPNGDTVNRTATTNASGRAKFRVDGLGSGDYTLTIFNIVLDGYEFDADNSTLSETLTIE